ncbi:MAG: hypothetical protein ACOY3X_03985 [Pseudomonadota bacterium]
MRIMTCVAFLLSVAVISGCSSRGLISSLEDINAESAKEGRWKVPQYRTLSIPGMLPFPDVGLVDFYKPNRYPSTAVGLSPNKSYVAEAKIEATTCKQECLIGIRDQLLTVQKKAENLITMRMQLSALRAHAENPDLDAAVKATAQSDYSQAMTGYATKSGEFAEAQENVTKLIKNSGVMIYRWTSSDSAQGKGEAGSFLSFGGKKSKIYNGFALISGIRTKTLHVGDDFPDSWGSLDLTFRFPKNYRNRFEMTTFVMQAQYVAYVSSADLESLIEGKISGSSQQLGDIKETLSSLDKIELGMVVSRMSNLYNSGVIGDVKRKNHDISWADFVKNPTAGEDDWHTFYAVKSDFRGLMKMRRNQGWW